MRSLRPLVALALVAMVGACDNPAPLNAGDAAMDATMDVPPPSCAEGQQRCDGRCVETEISREHCGACGNACPGGQICAAGSCRTACPSGQTVCGGTCVTVATDNANCGACGSACPAGQVCSAGRCALTCAETLAECGGGDGGVGRTCSDLASDRLNCGACGNRCGAGELCVNRACQLSCPMGQTVCGGRCVTLENDPAHCGACGTACASGQLCGAGACATSCPAGQTVCGGRCVTTDNDPAHCGACGTACASGQVCAMGACATSCPAGQAVCGASCVTLATDRAHCGACGTACAAGQACVMGACATSCPAGQTVCGGRCVTTDSDRANCGACGTACADGQVCVMGACATSCPAGQVVCDGRCVTTATDGAHCGACGAACATGLVCSMGACTLRCAAPLTECGADMSRACVDMRSDRANCGACGSACASGQVCNAGRCEISCPAGQSACGDVCVSTGTDPSNCGACGRACGAGQVCVSGACVTNCPTGQTACAGACVTLGTDRANCGACGTACATGEVCSNGACTVGCAMPLSECEDNGARFCANLATDRRNCGACGTVCGTGQSCESRACVTTCPSGQENCSGSCVTLATDAANCGACGVTCAAGERCLAGRCQISCPGAQVACGGACVSTQTDVRHCGACGAACTARANAAARCADSACEYQCNPSFGDCNGMAGDGCETDTSRAVRHCGACDNACPTPANAAPTCNAGTCGFACNAGFADCNGDPGDGCEVNLASSAASCGRCGRACPARANAAAACVDGQCGIACDADFADCDGAPANGCEVDTRTASAHCGRCGNACVSGANSTPACVASACAITCAPSFGDCDGSATNGCEVDTRTSNAHCGACGNACVGAARCAASACTTCTLATTGTLAIPTGTGVTTIAATLPAVAGSVTSQFASHSCRSAAAGAEHIYTFTLGTTTALQIYTTGSTDPTLSIRGNCNDGATELACDDDGGASLNAYVRRVFAPGTYYVIVDSNSTSALAYTLNLSLWSAAAPNGTCGAATPLVEGAPLTAQNPAGGGDRTTLCQSSAEGGQLFYVATIPGGRRATFTMTQTSGTARTLAMRVLDGCPATACAASLSTTSLTAQTLTVDNALSSPRTVYVGVSAGDMATQDASFSLALTTAALPYVTTTITAACDSMTGGTAVTFASTTSDDSNSVIAALPFTLPYFNATASHYSVTTNGFLQLWTSSSGTPSTAYSNGAMTSAPNGAVAPFWDDLGFPSMESYGAVTREINDGGGRRFVVQWTNFADYSALTARLTFQVKLFDTGAIELHYCAMTNSNTTSNRHLGDSATVGLRAIDGASSFQVGTNTVGLTRPGTGYRIAAP